jgi:acetyltransferase-like isoleucine patch superfamily enzyme
MSLWARQNDNDLVRIYPNCIIADDVDIGEFSIIGKPSRPNYNSSTNSVDFLPLELGSSRTSIREGCYIGSHVLIEQGVSIELSCIIESACVVESGARIGAHSLLVQGARVCRDAVISEYCIVGGFVAERSIVGRGSRILGMLIHKQENPRIPWDDNVEPAPRIGEQTFVGMGATVIGGVTIGDKVYICTGAVITKDVPPMHIVEGVNKAIPFEQWKGQLKDSPFWNK